MTLQVENLSYAYAADQPVLHDVSFRLEPGQTLYVLGRNGSGKTTMLSCIAGLLKPNGGRVLLDGKDIHAYKPAERARRIGLIPQVHSPAFSYAVHEMVLMGRAPHLSLLGEPTRTDDEVVERALESVGIAELRDRPYTELSGGERQLVLIARGLAQQADILLMDEPSAHLDLSNQYRVLDMVDQLSDQGLSFVISSHAPNNALTYADRVLLMGRGRVLAFGPPAETLTPDLLTAAYGMRAEVIYGHDADGHGLAVPRAILPHRPLVLPPESLGQAGSMLHAIFERSRAVPQLLLISGISGDGKTTWCGKVIEAARAEGLTVRGLLSPPVFGGERKTAIDLVDLRSDERRRLAVLRGERASKLATVQWAFDPEVVAWGNETLRDPGESDLLVIDELGPLEFVRGQGFINGLHLIDAGQHRVACVVVRSALLADALQRWPHGQVVNGFRVKAG